LAQAVPDIFSDRTPIDKRITLLFHSSICQTGRSQGMPGDYYNSQRP
jgi:hypothetical protein